jgi:hypothetical protein
MNINRFSTVRIKLLNCIFLVFVASFLVSGCGESEQKNVASKKVIKKYAVATTLKGSVVGKEGAVMFGAIKATDEKGQVVASTKLQNSKHYSIEIPAGTVLPLLLTFKPAADQVDTKTMSTAVIHPTMKKIDINLLTTAIAKKAKSMGGYTQTNMVLAAKSSVSMPRSNQTLGGFTGDPTKQYGGWH